MELLRETIRDIIRRALNEDIGSGDITTLAVVPNFGTAKGLFVTREPGVVAGIDVAAEVFKLLSDDIVVKSIKKDGDILSTGDTILEVSGSTRPILMGERVALNLIQRMSGIATLTYKLTQLISHTKAKVVDTRKTTPGLRVLEKYSVRAGGGSNHRFGLYDGILIKDNHIVAAGSIGRAVSAARAAVPHTIKIEVECDTEEQVAEALDSRADIIMLDNMTVAQMKKMVSFIDGRALVEASGNITEATIAGVAETGVDLISVGKLTHSVNSLDIGLDIINA